MYKQFVLFKFKFNLLCNETQFSTVKLRKVGFSPVASRAVWRSPLSDDMFHPEPWKNGADSCCRFREKRQKRFHKMMLLWPSTLNLKKKNQQHASSFSNHLQVW